MKNTVHTISIEDVISETKSILICGASAERKNLYVVVDICNPANFMYVLSIAGNESKFSNVNDAIAAYNNPEKQ